MVIINKKTNLSSVLEKKFYIKIIDNTKKKMYNIDNEKSYKKKNKKNY